jgi:hypothetical protein
VDELTLEKLKSLDKDLHKMEQDYETQKMKKVDSINAAATVPMELKKSKTLIL